MHPPSQASPMYSVPHRGWENQRLYRHISKAETDTACGNITKAQIQAIEQNMESDIEQAGSHIIGSRSSFLLSYNYDVPACFFMIKNNARGKSKLADQADRNKYGDCKWKNWQG